MTKEQVFEMLDKESWDDGNGNATNAEGSIKSVWGYNKNNAVTIHKVHYTVDPYFKTPCGDTDPILTICIQNGKMSIIPDAKMDSIDFSEYTWVGENQISKAGYKIPDLMSGKVKF